MLCKRDDIVHVNQKQHRAQADKRVQCTHEYIQSGPILARSCACVYMRVLKVYIYHADPLDADNPDESTRFQPL